VARTQQRTEHTGHGEKASELAGVAFRLAALRPPGALGTADIRQLGRERRTVIAYEGEHVTIPRIGASAALPEVTASG
jgi:hypothetical protein